MDPIRCPYCVYRDEFKIMIPQGIYYVCEKCGHIVAAPGLPIYECQCSKCQLLKGVG